MIKKLILYLATTSGFLVLVPLPAYANHSWGGYHWARTTNPFSLGLGDNLSSGWDPYLVASSMDWSVSTVLDTTIVKGGTNPRLCRPTVGRVEICNSSYGRNRWLGLAQIWVSSKHITKGVVKVNDTYFNTPTYSRPAWKNLVLCQEVGHMLGLDHQDEIFNNAPLGTCMDYTNDPTPNQHPNQHDYDELGLVYSHLDSTNTVKKPQAQSTPQSETEDTPNSLGKLVKKRGRTSIYEIDRGRGEKIVTFVIAN